MAVLPSLQVVPSATGVPATHTWFEQTRGPAQTLVDAPQSASTLHWPGVPAQLPLAVQTSS